MNVIEARMGVRISNGIAIGPSIGVQLAGRGGGPKFLFRDDFLTDEAAPLASPRAAEPGPGTLTLVQDDGQFSISDGKLNFPAQATPSFGDQGFYSSAGLARAAGMSVVFRANLSTATVLERGYIGWAASAAVSAAAINGHLFGFNTSGGSISARVDTVNPDVGTFATATDYNFAVVLRSAGAYWFVKGGSFSNWTLLYVDNVLSTATMYPAFINHSLSGTLDTFRVLDLPAPFNTDYGLATDRIEGEVSVGQTFTHEADCVIEWTQTALPSSGFTNVWVRRQDANNAWIVQVNSAGTIGLFEHVAGSSTSRGSASGVVSNGHRIVVVADGTTIRVYSNNALRITYSSASNFATEMNGELSVLGTGGAISNFVTWPRTLPAVAARLLDKALKE